MPRSDTRETHEQGTGRGTCSWIHSKLKVSSSGKDDRRRFEHLDPISDPFFGSNGFRIECSREMAFIHK